MHIRKPTYKKEDVDCKLCTEYRGKKHPCPHDVCPFIAERIEAGAVTYWDAVNAMISSQYCFSRRLPKLAEELISFTRRLETEGTAKETQ